MSLGLYGPGMHQFILDEMELGFRVAVWLDMEHAEKHPPAILDIQYVRQEENK